MLKRIEYCCYDIGSAVLICSNLEVSWYCLTICEIGFHRISQDFTGFHKYALKLSFHIKCPGKVSGHAGKNAHDMFFFYLNHVHPVIS